MYNIFGISTRGVQGDKLRDMEGNLVNPSDLLWDEVRWTFLGMFSYLSSSLLTLVTDCLTVLTMVLNSTPSALTITNQNTPNQTNFQSVIAIFTVSMKFQNFSRMNKRDLNIRWCTRTWSAPATKRNLWRGSWGRNLTASAIPRCQITLIHHLGVTVFTIFRHASVSSTYPCKLVRALVTP